MYAVVRSALWADQALDGLACRIEARLRSEETNEGLLTLGVVFLAWDRDATETALKDLTGALAAMGPLNWRGWVVDNNATEPKAPMKHRGWTTVSGDNSVREFSGYQRGLEAARDDHAAADVWLLANDRMLAYGQPFLRLLTRGAVSVVNRAGALAGLIDRYPASTSSLGHDVTAWATTNFVLIADEALKRLGSVVSMDQEAMNALVSSRFPGKDGRLLPVGELGPRHVRYLEHWLAGGEGSGLRESWYRQRVPDAASWPDFRAKLLSILNEQLLTARARTEKIPVISLRTAYRLGCIAGEQRALGSALAVIRRSRLLPGWTDRGAGRLRLAMAAATSALFQRQSRSARGIPPPAQGPGA